MGVDGLTAFVEEQREKVNTPYLVVLLNAFCNDVYFAAYNNNNQAVEIGCLSIFEFIKLLENLLEMTAASEMPLATCVGNGVLLHRSALLNQFGCRIIIPENVPNLCSMKALYAQAWRRWTLHETAPQLLPLYLKDLSAR